MSIRLRGWILAALAMLGGAGAMSGCSPKKRGTLPVDSPIYQAPNDDPSAEEAAEDGADEEPEKTEK